MKIAYAYNPTNGAYLGETIAFADPLTAGAYLMPANATDIAPPDAGANQVAVWGGGAWTLDADYVGWTGYDANGNPVSINAIGQAPQSGWTTTKPAPTAAQQWAAYQASAQAQLDIVTGARGQIIRCAAAGVAVPSAWTTYVQALRAIISQAQPATIPTSLPAQPAYVAGT